MFLSTEAVMDSDKSLERAERRKLYVSTHFQLSERPEAMIEECNLLLSDTDTACISIGIPRLSININPGSAGFFFEELKRAIVRYPQTSGPELMSLVPRWWRYVRNYQALLERSPLLELERYLGRLSESDRASTWVDSIVEERLAQWLDGGAVGICPVKDRHGVLSGRTIDRLKRIRSMTGGWIYGYIWGTYFLTDTQKETAPRGEGAREYLEEAQRTRPSFEGM